MCHNISSHQGLLFKAQLLLNSKLPKIAEVLLFVKLTTEKKLPHHNMYATNVC